MKRERVLALTLTGALLILPGCGRGNGAPSQMEAVQETYSRLNGFTARAEVTADYGERVYGYTVDIRGDGDSGAMTVTEPENIAGTLLTWSKGETGLECDGTELDTGALAPDGLSPADAVPAVLAACGGGTVRDCCMEKLGSETLLRATLDPGGPAGRQITCWFRPEDRALVRAELAREGRTVVTLAFSEFALRTEKP